MQNLYEILKKPTKEILERHSIKYFDSVIERYPKYYKDIIAYINDCFNYHSDLLTEEKDWGRFLMERFEENCLPDDLMPDIIEYESEQITYAISMFLAEQKQSTFTTFVAKQNLRMQMLAIMQKSSSTTSDKKNANDMVSSLDIELSDILERFRSSNKIFGNFVGYNQVKTARNRHLINVAQFID